MQDSHFELPVVDTKLDVLANTDFAPFVALNKSRWAMTAHIVYQDIDPFNSATHSKAVIDVIRNKIHFNNIIITDCITMQALKDGYKINAKKSFDAGCDLVLFSKPNLNDAMDVLSVTPNLNKAQFKKICEAPKITSKDNVETLLKKLNAILEKYNINTLTAGKDPTTQHAQ